MRKVLGQQYQGASPNSLGCLILAHNIMKTVTGDDNKIPHSLLQTALIHYSQDTSPPAPGNLNQELDSRKIQKMFKWTMINIVFILIIYFALHLQ